MLLAFPAGVEILLNQVCNRAIYFHGGNFAPSSGSVVLDRGSVVAIVVSTKGPPLGETKFVS